MQQLDLNGEPVSLPPPPAQPTLTHNTRPPVAEEKAQLAFQLGVLCRQVPACVRGGSVQQVQTWQAYRKEAMKLLRSPRASVHQLRSAISSMERFA